MIFFGHHGLRQITACTSLSAYFVENIDTRNLNLAFRELHRALSLGPTMYRENAHLTS